MSRPDDEESADASTGDDGAVGLDVTPRPAPEQRGADRPTLRRNLGIAAVVVLLGGLGVVVFRGLTDAATFYYDVDEALERRDELGDRRFRMQGNALEGTIDETDEGVEFVIAYDDEEVPVRHLGDTPELFSPEIPVIIEGSFDGDEFVSDEILVRHDSTYEEENGDRLREAQEDADRRASEAG